MPTANIATEMSPATYGAVVLQHFRRPLNRKDVIGATAIGEAANPLCGDRIRISASVAGDVIADIGFSGDACAVCVAAASLLTERVRGSSRIAAGAISDEALIASLETELPPARVRCATLPLDALRRALRVSPRHDDVAAVVLAAGRGTRFGGDKLSALLDGEPIIGHVVRNLAGFVGRVIVVAGPNPSPIQAIVGAGADVVSNGRAAEGMSTSLIAGLDARGGCSAIMVLLGDQPGIDRGLISAVVDGWRANSGPIIAASYRGLLAPPVVFGRGVFEELRALTGDRGAKSILDSHSHRVVRVPWDRDPPVDVDTPEDLARAERSTRD